MSRGDQASLLDILQAVHRIAQFKGRLGRAPFLNDAKTQSSVLHQLLVIGEASKRLSPGFRAKHHGIPWREIAGMRDKLIHAYDVIDLEEVWDTITKDLPRLAKAIRPLAPKR